MIIALLLCSALLGLFVALEVSARRYKLSPEITRRVAHVVTGLFAIVAYSIFSSTIFLICATLLTIVICVSYAKSYFTSIHKVRRNTYGEIFLPLGIVAAYVISGSSFAIYLASLLIITFADPLAGLVSDIRKVRRSTVTGSIVFFITTVVILTVTHHSIGMLSIVLVSAIITIIERVSRMGSDNLTVPTVTALLLVLL